MGLMRRIAARLPWIALILALLMLADGYRWWQAVRLNHAIDNGEIVKHGDNVPPEGLFAQAYFAMRQGNQQSAIALYKRIEAQPVLAELKLSATYNRGNRYLQQAIALHSEDNQQLSVPLAEMAKDAYRSVLRSDPSHWDAKYNLERALRLVPDPDDTAEEEAAMPQQSERAVTTMRGFSLGLP
jgi:mxaK protein